jgi:hypothetical protein
MRMVKQSAAAALIAAAIVAASSPQPLAGQTVTGRLLVDPTNQPLSGATVALLTTPAPRVAVAVTTKTGNDGSFSLRAPSPGVYRVLAELPGYRTLVSPAIELRSGDRLDFTVRLIADTSQMRSFTLNTNTRNNVNRLTGVGNRSRTNAAFGRFLDRNQIEQSHAITVSDLLRTMPGLQVVPSSRGFGYDVLTTEGCRPAVFLDGVHYPLLPGETIDDVVHPLELDAVEVYPHAAEVPAEFATAAGTCGAIVLWTRRGP